MILSGNLKKSSHRVSASELASQLVTFSLKRFSFEAISEHVLKNAGYRISSNYSSYDWIYLSNFYASPHATSGLATKQLQLALSSIQKPFILCCEPLLGTDPRSLTTKNYEWTSEERYNALCKYYKVKFNLQHCAPICCTLKTELTGHGKRWSDLERKLIWGIHH